MHLLHAAQRRGLVGAARRGPEELHELLGVERPGGRSLVLRIASAGVWEVAPLRPLFIGLLLFLLLIMSIRLQSSSSEHVSQHEPGKYEYWSICDLVL